MATIYVTLDPGHIGGYNTGYDKTYKEGTKMFTLAYFLKEELEKYDLFKVFVTRKDVMENPDLATRAQMAINTSSRVFISLHSNAATPAACGSEIFMSLKRPGSKALAEKLVNAVVDTMKPGCPKTKSRGVKTKANSSGTDYYGVIRNSVKSSVVEYSYILEHGFHTNPAECAWIVQDSNLRKLAIAEAKVLAEHFGAKLKTTPKEEADMKEELEALKKQVAELKKTVDESNKVYKTVNDVPSWAKPTVLKLVEMGALKGTGNGNLDLSVMFARILVILDRTGAFDKK